MYRIEWNPRISRYCWAVVSCFAVSQFATLAFGQEGVGTGTNSSSSSADEVVVVHRAQLCGLVSTFSTPSMRNPNTLAHARAMIQAVDDVNARNCTILGPGCESRVSWTGGRLQLGFSLWELDGSSRSTPSAIVRCIEEGGNVVVGPTTTPQTESAMLLANVYDVPVVGYASSSTLFSNQDVYRNYARSFPSDEVKVEALIQFFTFMGWEQVAVFYKSTAYGFSLEESLTSSARRQNITLETISLGTESLTDETYELALSQLESLGHKVVVLLLNPIELVNMLLAADARGMNTSSYVWTSTEQFYSAFGVVAGFLPPPVAAKAWKLLTGLIAPGFPVPPQGAKLKEHILSSQLTPAALNDYAKNITGSAVTIPISEQKFAESAELIEAQQVTASAYDSVWLIAEAWAKALQAQSAAAVMDAEGDPGDTDSAGTVHFLLPRPSLFGTVSV